MHIKAPLRLCQVAVTTLFRRSSAAISSSLLHIPHINALFRRYSGAIQALILRRYLLLAPAYEGSITALQSLTSLAAHQP